MNFEHNTITQQTLEDFLNFPDLPFAILLKGEWGCGKTWFIKNFIQCHSEDNTFFHISLFGISTVNEFNKAVVSAIIPALSGNFKRSATIVGKIISSFGFSIPYFRIYPDKIFNIVTDSIEKLIKKTNLIFVFDDFERCHINPDLLFGCISAFIEKEHTKVIIICNEEFFKACQKCENDRENQSLDLYERYKEKIIGITLSIQPDVVSVFDYNVEKINKINFADRIKELLVSNRQIVIDIFNGLDSHNLRNIERLIIEFTRVVTSCPEELRNNNIFMQDVLSYISAHSIALADKKISIDHMNRGSRLITAGSKEKNPYYSIPYLNSINMGAENFWISFFSSGILTSELEEYYNSRFKFYTQPIPIQLWHYYDLDDETFSHLLATMNDELENGKYTNPGIILHAFTIKLSLSKNGLLDETPSDIVNAAKKYLSKYSIDFSSVSSSSLGLILGFRGFTSYAGLGFQDENSPEFNELIEILSIKLSAWREGQIKERIDTIFHKIESTPQDYHNDLFELRNDFLSAKMLLKLVSPDRLTNLLSTTLPAKRRNICNDFIELLKASRRHAEDDETQAISLWLEEFKVALSTKADESPKTLKHFHLMNCVWLVENEKQKF